MSLMHRTAATPVIQELVRRSAAIKQRELDRLFRSEQIASQARPEVEAVCDAIIASLIADPARRHCAQFDGDSEHLLRTLFGLD